MHSRFFPRPLCIWLLAGAMSLAAGCASSSGSSGDSTGTAADNVITTGTISGLAFTVVEGTVTQDATDGPITAGATRSTVIFDSDLSTLATSTKALFQVKSTMSAGGYVAVLGYGSSSDDYAAALMGGLSRDGSSIEYGLLWGQEDTPPVAGSFADPVDNPDGNIPLIVGMDNSYSRAVIGIWDPDTTNTAPFDTCDTTDEIEDDAGIAGGGVVDKGNGLGAGIVLESATVSAVDLSDAVALACW